MTSKRSKVSKPISRDYGNANVGFAVPGFVVWQLFSPGLIAILVNTHQLVAAGVCATVLFSALAVVKLKAAVAWVDGRGPALLVDLLLALTGVILSIVYLVILGHPQQSILYRMNFGGYDVTRELPFSFAVIACCIFIATMQLPTRRIGSTVRTWEQFRPATATILAFVGVIGLLATLATSRAEAFQQRDSGGIGGLITFAYWGASAYVVYTILGWKKPHSLIFPALGTALALGLIFSGNRSPVALIGLAVLVRLVADRRVKTIAITVCCLPVGLLVFSYQAVWRGLVARSLPSDPASVFKIIFADPSAALVRLGLDSIDGHALTVDLLRQGFAARPWDLATAVLNFVPRALWESKPTLLGGEIGRLYLGTSGSGIFLSGPGYLSLVAGSTTFGAILFVVLILAIKSLARRPRHLFFVVAAAYLATRFTIAGDAFDVFLALQLIVIFTLAEFAGSRAPLNTRLKATL